MTQTKSVVVRNEEFGLLVWSPKLDSYFLPEKESIGEIKTIIERKKQGLSASAYDNINPELVSDLILIGFNGKITEINQPLENRLSAPLDMYFDYTNSCNLLCPMCYNWFNDRKITMSDEKIVKILSGAASMGTMRTHLAGGEPMINHPRLTTYLKTANSLGMNVSVNSNGTLLSETILETLFDNNLITLTFSIDGHTSELHDAIRGKGNFEKTRINAKMAAKEKQNMNIRTKLQYKIAHMFNTPLDTYEGLINLAIDDGMNRVQFHNPECSVLHPKGHYNQSNIIEGYYERIILLKSLEMKYKEQIEIWKPWNPITGCADIGLPNYHGCIGGQELIAIDANGEIRPCLMDKYALGNVFNDWNGDLNKFWKESEKLKAFQLKVDEVDPHCNACNTYSQCRGGRKTRIIVNNKTDADSEEISLSHLSGYDPYCSKDYLENHNNIIMQEKRTTYIKMNKHKQIFVAHSL